MNLKPRERFLLIVTGGMVGVLVVYLLFSSLTGSRDYADRENLQNLVDQKTRDINAVRRAFTSKHGAEALAIWREWSPHVDPRKAGSEYHDWLAELSRQAGFEEPDVQASLMHTERGLGYSLPYTIRARVDMNQLVQFLHAFYSAERMHRIESLTIKPVGGSSRFDLTLRVELLSLDEIALATVERFQILDRPVDKSLHDALFAGQNGISLQDARALSLLDDKKKRAALLGQILKADKAADRQAAILDAFASSMADTVREALDSKSVSQRHVLALLPLQSQEKQAELCRRIQNEQLSVEDTEAIVRRLTIAAQWEDSDQENGRGWLAGVDRTLEGYRGRIVGRDLFAVYEPPVEDPGPGPPPPPPPPGFDAARYAVIIAIVHDDQGPEVWIESRTEGTTYRLRQGGTLQIGECHVQVLHIRSNDLVCDVDGEPRYFVRGDSLRDGESFYE